MSILTNSGWSVDKKIPIALIGSILITTGTWIWYMSSAFNRIGVAETAIVRLDSEIEKLKISEMDLKERAVKSDSAINSMSSIINRIDGKLDRLIEKDYGKTFGPH